MPEKVITYDMGAELAREKGWGFMEVSAKEDINIKTAFSTLCSNIFQVVTKTSGGSTNAANQLTVGENRAASISLHGQNNAVGKSSKSGSSKSAGGKKKKDSSGCCK